MDYITWVNSNIKQSYRYKRILGFQKECQTQLASYQQRLESVRNGTIPLKVFGSIGFIPEFYDSYAVFTSITDSFKRDIGIPEEEIHNARVQEKAKREQMEVESRRKTEISICEDNITRYLEYIENSRIKLEECEHSTVATWLNLPEEEWGKELAFRLMDNPLRPFQDCPDLGGTDLDVLFHVVEYLALFLRIKTKLFCDVDGYHYCTMAIFARDSASEAQISVTRRSYSLAGCIQRTMLTLLDLSWQKLIDSWATGESD